MGLRSKKIQGQHIQRESDDGAIVIVINSRATFRTAGFSLSQHTEYMLLAALSFPVTHPNIKKLLSKENVPSAQVEILRVLSLDREAEQRLLSLTFPHQITEGV